MSCDAVPAATVDGAGTKWGLRTSAACGARVGAAESVVSFIPCFAGGPHLCAAVLDHERQLPGTTFA
jgi:hypothetical protein